MKTKLKKAIQFKDITPILSCSKLFRTTINAIARKYRCVKIDKIAAIDARGFIFGAALAFKLKIGFVPIRKKGKLPWKTIQENYDLEYGSNTIEIHSDAINKGDSVLLVDDLLATGGTAEAAIKLINKSEAKVIEAFFVIELEELNGRNKLQKVPVSSLVKF